MPRLLQSGPNFILTPFSCTFYPLSSLLQQTTHSFLKYATQNFMSLSRQFFSVITLITPFCSYLPAELKTQLNVTSVSLSLMPLGRTNLPPALCFLKPSVITSTLNQRCLHIKLEIIICITHYHFPLSMMSSSGCYHVLFMSV